MESLVSKGFSQKAQFWNGKRVFVTGHTGFKGSWLCAALHANGAIVKGYALEPIYKLNTFDALRLKSKIESEIGDIRDQAALSKSVKKFKPEIIIHLAAQPLVRQSYLEPVETYTTNIMGTVNLLEAVANCETAQTVVNVTTDKVYENIDQIWGYRENDRLGGHDPYSSSKACSDLITTAYARSFLDNKGMGIATARAGNVIGGGDWSRDRLVPDIFRSINENSDLHIRFPKATRPWQHVIEPVLGYLQLAKKLHREPKNYSSAWNFGPLRCDEKSVGWMVNKLIELLNADIKIVYDTKNQPHEANLLSLDVSKSINLLGWKPKWDTVTALKKTAYWHTAFDSHQDMFSISLEQLYEYRTSSHRV